MRLRTPLLLAATVVLSTASMIVPVGAAPAPVPGTLGDVSYTSVYTVTDELVQPFWTADLQGGANIKIQDLCPGRVGEHFEMVFDSAAYGVVLDALTHPGPADLSRVDRSLCLQLTMPGVTPTDLVAGEVDAWTAGWPALNEPRRPGTAGRGLRSVVGAE
jgi:hypothetical protein